MSNAVRDIGVAQLLSPSQLTSVEYRSLASQYWPSSVHEHITVLYMLKCKGSKTTKSRFECIEINLSHFT